MNVVGPSGQVNPGNPMSVDDPFGGQAEEIFTGFMHAHSAICTRLWP